MAVTETGAARRLADDVERLQAGYERRGREIDSLWAELRALHRRFGLGEPDPSIGVEGLKETIIAEGRAFLRGERHRAPSTVPPEVARERVKDEAGGLSGLADSARAAAVEAAVMVERVRCIHDVCVYCAGKHPAFSRQPTGPDDRGEWTHGKPSAPRAGTTLCRASAIHNRWNREDALLSAVEQKAAPRGR